MKTFTLGLMAAAALSSCVRGAETNPQPSPSDDKIEVTLSLSQPHSRAATSVVSDGDIIEIQSGYLAFSDGNGMIRVVYTLSSRATDKTNINIADLNSGKPCKFSGIPAVSKYVTLYANVNADPDLAPSFGHGRDEATNALWYHYLSFPLIADNKHAMFMGESELDFQGGNKASVSITPITQHYRVQIVTIGSTDVNADIDGIFMNNILDANAANAISALIPDDFEAGSAFYPDAMKGYTYDTGGYTIVANRQITLGDKLWSYNLWNQEGRPQIVVKLSNVKVALADGTLYPMSDPQYVTVTGFVDKDGKRIENFKLDQPMVYTIRQIELSSKRLNDHPGVGTCDVTVSITPVVWDETAIDPEY